MDSLTQIVLGAAVGEVVLGRKVGNRAMLWGAIAGTIPDLDVYQSFFYDSLRANELHRGVSHSLVFSLFVAPLLGWLIKYKEKALLIVSLIVILGYPILKNDHLGVQLTVGAVLALLVFLVARTSFNSDASDTGGWRRLAFWSLVTHPLLDCHTTWGTQFLWPLPHRLAWNNIFVADPAYTVPFMVFVAVAMFYKRESKTRRMLNWLGIAVSSLYMVWTLGVKYHVHTVFTQSLVSQNIGYTRLTTHPTPLNSILWVGTADGGDQHYLGLYSLFDSDRDIAFDSIATQHQLLDNWQEEDVVKRLRFLSKDWYAVRESEEGLFFYDGRFGAIQRKDTVPYYAFGYLLYTQNGELKAKQEERPFDDAESYFAYLIERLRGD